MSITVTVELKETSQPLVYEAENTYQKGDMFCVYIMGAWKSRVCKFPVANIWRVTEDYHAKGKEA